MKRKIWHFATGPSGIHYIKMQYSGISTLICYVDGFTMHYFDKDKNIYLKLDDAIAWHEKEFTITKKERYHTCANALKIGRQNLIDGRVENV